MKRASVVVTTAAAVVAVAAPAWAYYALSSTTATATATARTLGTPAVPAPAVAGSTVSFAVTPPATGPVPGGYRVARTAPTAVATVCTLPAAGGTCTDTAAVAGQTNTYAVSALLGSWQSLTPATVSASVPSAGSFTMTGPSTPVAGTPFTVTITAKNGAGATDLTYSGSKTLTWDGGKQLDTWRPVYPSPVTFTNGVATASVTLYKAGSQTLTVTDANTTSYTGSLPVTVGAAGTALAFSNCPVSPARNSSFTTTVTRTGNDPYGNPAGTPAVTVTLTPSSGSAKFTTGSVPLAAGALATAPVTFNTASSAGATATLGAAATGHTAAACTVTTAS